VSEECNFEVPEFEVQFLKEKSDDMVKAQEKKLLRNFANK